MSLVPSRPPAPDSEACGLTAPFPERTADRIHALARRILASCHMLLLDDPAFGLDGQFATLDAVFRELLLIDTAMHGLDERRGLTLALQAQKQALSTHLIAKEIQKYDGRTIEQ